MEEAILLLIATGIQGAASAIPTMIAVQTAEVQAAARLAATAVVALPAAIAVVVHLATVIVAVLPAAVQVVRPIDQMDAPALVAAHVLPEVHAATAAHQTEDPLLPMADHLAQARATVRVAAPVAGQAQEGNLLLAEEPAAVAAPAEVNPLPADKNKEGE